MVNSTKRLSSTGTITEPGPAIIHFKNTRKSSFACITLLSRVLGEL